jgi:DNA mismatch endonuclease (patch repair protein)
MPDVFPAATRSRIMSAIRSRGNRSTELRLIQVFRDNGIIGWRRGARLLGCPDFVFRKQRIVIFVDGCFWHGCPRCRNTPATNAAYWEDKNRRNRERDRFVTRVLARSGWRVVRIWEHRLRQPQTVGRFLAKVFGDAPRSERDSRDKSASSVSSALYKTRRGRRKIGSPEWVGRKA